MGVPTLSTAETSQGVTLRIYMSLSLFSLTLPLPTPVQFL
jgi:hypothetical protein